MAGNPAGDIPGGRHAAPIVVTHASVASGGANARLGQVGPFGFAWRPTKLWWTPTGADNAASSTASYRRLSMYNGGTAGTGTATASRAASLNLTASKASLAPVAMTVDTAVTFASGEVAYFSQETVTGADANGTVLVAGQFGGLEYEIL